MPGGGEILVILILVLLLFGPDKLPELARQVGRGVRDLNRMKSNLTDQFNLMDDDDTPHHLRDVTKVQSNAFSADSRLEDDETPGWNEDTANANAANENADANATNSNGMHHDLARDEDDLAEDQADWRNCEEEPPSQAPQARTSQVQVPQASQEASQAETPGEATSFDRLSDGERPAPPGAVARSSSLPRVGNDEGHASG